MAMAVFPGLPVANDQLPLAPADGDHGVDALQPGLKRFLHRLPLDDVGGLAFDEPEFIGVDGPLAIDGLTQGVDDPSDQGISHGNGEDLACPPNLISLFDLGIVAQDHGPDIVLFEVEGHPVDSLGKFKHLGGHATGKPLDPGDPVPGLDDLPYLFDLHLDLKLLDVLLQDGGYLFRIDLQFHGLHLFLQPPFPQEERESHLIGFDHLSLDLFETAEHSRRSPYRPPRRSPLPEWNRPPRA